MGQCYRQVTREDRFAFWLAEKITKAEIARRLGFHRSTLTREIRRNSSEYGYTPGVAHRNSQIRSLKKAAILSKNPELIIYILEKLKVGWSPEQIAGRLKHHNDGLSSVSHETIYKYIYSRT